MLLRPASPADLPLLITLLRRSWLATFAADLPFEAVQAFAREDPARTYVEAMWPAFTVAEFDGRVAGMCHIIDDLVAAIHVDPAAKRCGIGTALMDRAEADILDRHPAARLEVLSCNGNARAFYKSRGWLEQRRLQTLECGTSVEAIEMRMIRRAR